MKFECNLCACHWLTKVNENGVEDEVNGNWNIKLGVVTTLSYICLDQLYYQNYKKGQKMDMVL